MKKINLTKGKFAIVDDDDFEYLNQFKWSLCADKYAQATINKKSVYMHRLVNKTPDAVITDHINGNGLDNRKSNLRNATKSQNAINTGMRINNTSGHKGIYQHKNQRWYARIFIQGKAIALGGFECIEDAIQARNDGEVKYHKI